MTELNQFHNFAHIFISLIGAILLLTIYYNIRRRFSEVLNEGDAQKRVDRGLLFLSLSLFIWVISGIWSYLAERFEFAEALLFSIGVDLLSIVNNMFILLALYYFVHAPSFIYKNEKSVKIILSIIIFITFSTLFISNFWGTNVVNSINLNALPDLLLSGFLSYLMAITFYRTFAYRGLNIVGILSVLVIGLIFYSQLPASFLNLDNDFANYLINIIAKTSLISIFLVLATTWVIELANTPKVEEIQLKFLDWGLIQLSIPSKRLKNVQIDFGSKTTQFKNLLKFALRRKYADGENQCIQIGAGGEVKNQTYLTRIIDNINDIQGQSTPTLLERKDLFTFLGNGNYRLRMLSDHITIEESLQKEFLEASENHFYKSIIKEVSHL